MLARLPVTPLLRSRPATTLLSAVLPSPRSYYTWDVPTNTPRVTLDDGSTLIHRYLPTANLPSLGAGKPGGKPKLPPMTRPQSYLYSDPSPREIEEIRKLRTADPDTWTVGALAKKYKVCAEHVMQIAPAPEARTLWVEKQAAEQWLASSPARKLRVVQRIRRRERW
ncbi:hypothetical protein BDK51DRAFT_29066 [Blyttiomyces helicus]|uniref:Mitochondrial ribosomal protein subunit L20-domain-containing protein n=1 Tax=Blyttiomyces helicus TaxID=388810 RepID=A0A4P9WDZ9_9FUNG|nr:hypothetical protein BDK51DRAFT_29066 [Blyttiomyces helicus]|eukprot:RKO90804.1 hypothetical protein BDK51DRAFT_29066 [Blyttiomyces helicus]